MGEMPTSAGRTGDLRGGGVCNGLRLPVVVGSANLIFFLDGSSALLGTFAFGDERFLAEESALVWLSGALGSSRGAIGSGLALITWLPESRGTVVTLTWLVLPLEGDLADFLGELALALSAALGDYFREMKSNFAQHIKDQ